MTTAGNFYSARGMPNNSSVDADMDMYFDFNQAVPTSSSSAKSPTSATSSTRRMSNIDRASSKQVFGGPSHEYGRFKQQTGLPNGAVSNVIAYNDSSSDFDAGPSFGYGSGYGSGIGMDMDVGPSSDVQPYMFLDGPPSAFDEFVDPTAIDAASAAPPPAVNRPWPGMHSQQAQQAKAEAAAKQQKQQQMGQQIMQQRMQQQRQSISSNRSSVSQQGGSRKPSQTPTDPHVEESISRVLDQMRHNSRVSPIDEDDEDMSNEYTGRSGRQRREDDDMDDDERLLASEEGKKLTSKERRQLRNKVSARAFRSRRKEYISQLEGEVAAKNNECNDLKAQNRNLMDQNSQLTRLTQTLLRHPAFATFLDDMSNDPSILATLQSQALSGSQRHEEPTSQPSDEPQAKLDPEVEEHNAQVGMAMMPHTSLDLSMLNLGNAHWGSGNSQYTYQQPQVFSVMDLPRGPPIDRIFPSNLSGKRDGHCDAPAKTDYPVIDSLPSHSCETSKVQPSITRPSTIEAESSDSLYSDVDASNSIPGCTVEEAARMLENSLTGKVPVHFNMVTRSTDSPETAMRRIKHMFAALEPTYRRIEALTAHLPSE